MHARLPFIALLLSLPSFTTSERPVLAEPGSALKPLAACDTGKDGRFLVIPVRIGSRDCSFLIDTGSSSTCFGKELAEHLGPSLGKEVVMTHGGKLEVETHACPPASWERLDLQKHARVISADLTPVRQASGLPIDGIVGMDVLQHYLLRVDFDAGRVQLFPPIADSHPEWGQRIPLQPGVGFTPAIAITLGDSKTEQCLVDTGANVSTLTSAISQELSEKGQFHFFCQNAWSSNPAGRQRSRSGHLSKCAVAGHTAESVRFDISNSCSLGLNVLSRFHLTLDFPGKSIQLLPGKRLSQADPIATSGLAIVWVNSELRVLSVQPGSPAELAGVKQGDSILEIDKLNTSGMDSFSVGRLLTSAPDRRLQIVVFRNSEPRELSLRLSTRQFAQ